MQTVQLIFSGDKSCSAGKITSDFVIGGNSYVNNSHLNPSQSQCEAAKIQMTVASEKNSVTPLSSYFAVQLPIAVRDKVPEDTCLCTSRVDALKVAKSYPGSRFKSFASRLEAEAYVRSFPPEIIPVAADKDTASKESSAYRTPKTQELLEFRRLIEFTEPERVETLVWSNPRLLIGSGDNPTIVQEGFHYNALHVTAMKNKPAHCRLILKTLENTSFWHLLYPEDTQETRAARIKFATDLYLNMPEKGNCETALHFACKFGFVEVVEALVTHPLVDKQRLNKFGQKAIEIVCQRMKNPDKALVDKITSLFEDCCYVPLLRAEDNSLPPRVAPVWEVGKAQSVETKLLNESMKIWAIAGPMSPQKADAFRQSWMLSPSAKRSDSKLLRDIKRADSDKGWERVGRYLADEMNVPWRESWPFLNVFDNLRQGHCLDKLEAYLERRSQDVIEQKSRSDISQLEQMMGGLVLNDSCQSVTCNTSAVDDDPDSSQSSRFNISDSQEEWVDNDNGSGTEEDMTTTDNNVISQEENTEVISQQEVVKVIFDINDEDKSSSSNETFHTAAEGDSESEREDFTDLSQSVFELPEVYLQGNEPCKLDLDVYNALDGIQLSPALHPLTYKWKTLVSASDPSVRSRWSTPRKNTKRSISAPDAVVSPLDISSISPLDISSDSPLDVSSNYRLTSIPKPVLQL